MSRPRPLYGLCVFLILAVTAPRVAAAQGIGPPLRWTYEFATGDAYNFPTRLDVHQFEHPLALQHATWDTRAFEFPIYWSLRAGMWRGHDAWMFELLHHKLFLDDPVAPVEHFSVSHGFNLLTASRVYTRGMLHYGLGAGAVIAHPENRVRGLELRQGGIGGFYLAGPTGLVLVGMQREVGRRMFVTAEARFAASYAHVPIEDGHASVVHLGVHGHLGIGYGNPR
jgi:hypothetical protein